MSDYAKCQWCGKKFEKKGLNKFLSHNTMGLAGKEDFCSEKCRQAAQGGSGTNSHASSQPAQSKEATEDALLAEREKRNAETKLRNEGKVEEIANLKFGSTTDEILEAMNQLVTIGSSGADTPVRKAIVEKMEFGIMKLKAAGMAEEVAYFEKKKKKIKPGWFD